MINVVIGYDRANRMLAYTAAESIMQHASKPVNFTFLHKDMLREYTRQQGSHDSTEFSNSRFLTPYLHDYSGWSLFVDNDIIVKHDIVELFALADNRYSVFCVKHDYTPKHEKKFLNYIQYKYQYKNWSSVMLFNNQKCKKLSLDYVNTADGLDLHQFKWLDSQDEIGSLPLEWNYLVDNSNQTTNTPKLIHYTDGGPYFKENRNCSYATDWLNVYRTINDVDK